MTDPMTPTQALVARVRRSHFECEDRFYSCPKSEGGCANDFTPEDICTCGADDANAALDQLCALVEAREGDALVERVAQCKGFEAAFHFMVPEWVVTDENLDYAEYRGATLTEALTKLADKYDAARTGGSDVR